VRRPYPTDDLEEGKSDETFFYLKVRVAWTKIALCQVWRVQNQVSCYLSSMPLHQEQLAIADELEWNGKMR
jgi:hypothetical protein